jgi:uncharacterized protein (DUF1778 family)
METQLQIKINHQEKELIKKAGKIIGLGHSTFARMVCLERAREILKENKVVEENNS